MTAHGEALASGVGQPGLAPKPAKIATYLIAFYAHFTRAIGLFGIWNAAKMPLAAQEGKHDV